MEFLLGSVATILAILLLRNAIAKDLAKNSKISIKYSQSHIYEIINGKRQI